MYHIIINSKICEDYKQLDSLSKTYFHNLMELTKYPIRKEQIKVVTTEFKLKEPMREYSIEYLVRHVCKTKLSINIELYRNLSKEEMFISTDYDKNEGIIKHIEVDFVDKNSNLWSLVIPSSFLITEEEYNNIRQNCDSRHAYHYDYKFPKSIWQRYNIKTSNIIFTNEITKNIRINFLQDKNYMIATHTKHSYPNHLSKNNYVINPNLYREFMIDCNLMPLEHLFELFGVDRKRLQKSLKQISFLTQRFIILGVGGTMGNFLYWLDCFQEYFDMSYIFKKITVFENDMIEYHNIFRIPILVPVIGRQKEGSHNKAVLAATKCRNIALDFQVNTTNFVYNYDYIRLRGSSIFVGTPDINTRKNLERFNLKFFCPTHQNNTIKIMESPVTEGDLHYESYGSIDLNKFLLNMFNMSVNLIYAIADNAKSPAEKNKLLFQQSFEEIPFIENSKKSKILKNIAYAIN